jgi:hypothetical protein
VCGTDGVQLHASGLGIVMGHDTKSVRCGVCVSSSPRSPDRGARDSRVSCLWTHSWMPAHDIRGHKVVRCYRTVYEFMFPWGLCREVPLFS